jgi:AcrR family transcriptional regulator
MHRNLESGKTACQNCAVATRRAYGGVSAEQRQAQRRAALLAAGLDIIGTPGHGRLTVAGLCSRAGLNERYFYENFSTAEDVLVAVFEEVIAELTSAIVAAIAAAPDETRAKARAAIAAAVELLTDDSRKTRVIFVEPLAAPVLNARRAEVARTFVALIVGQAQEFYGPATALRIGSWGDFAAAHLLGGLAETMTAWVRGDLAITRDELIERSTDLFVLVAEHVVGSAGTSPSPT